VWGQECRGGPFGVPCPALRPRPVGYMRDESSPYQCNLLIVKKPVDSAKKAATAQTPRRCRGLSQAILARGGSRASHLGRAAPARWWARPAQARSRPCQPGSNNPSSRRSSPMHLSHPHVLHSSHARARAASGRLRRGRHHHHGPVRVVGDVGGAGAQEELSDAALVVTRHHERDGIKLVRLLDLGARGGGVGGGGGGWWRWRRVWCE
jgi:hypothetical protein